MLSVEQVTSVHESIGKYENSALMLVKFLLNMLISVTNTREKSRIFFLFPLEVYESVPGRYILQPFHPTVRQVLDTEEDAKYAIEAFEEMLCDLDSRVDALIGKEHRAEYIQFENEVGVYFKQYFEDMDELKIPFEMRNPGLYSKGKDPRVCFKDILDLLPAFKCNDAKSSELFMRVYRTINFNETLTNSIIIKRICSVSSQINDDLINLHLSNAIADEVMCQNSRMLRTFVEASVIRYKIMDSVFFINQLDCEIVHKEREESSILGMIAGVIIGVCVLVAGCILKVLFPF
ncbi:hypothetical protein CWI42_041360 [Ordospora colligata]|uniref:Uncharacterized protein n=1 Tax=Ordospora colligata OC4 TaxID=1354746 RepID=A0A0B2UKZ7_9MICR|nr:uncharacterized protein M896_041370 [Ordospora colligata OC4]KHN69939.1 hypothetical protein M896_041370 [Ordospora colligata OC4]TBU16109.1 hypothetical protein CWI41_041360 [Ordospora colligata]TBU16322.1 hypothetical protein CWI40_041360 [Ordospora colligata]TBU19026.1 hypothetical protein CWI42_041360 [Ordospora colligata]